MDLKIGIRTSKLAKTEILAEMAINAHVAGDISRRWSRLCCIGKLNWTMDASGSCTVGRKENETVQQLDKIRVDESCFMVDGAELHFHPQREGKHKTYQRKIRDAISSRMRSARKKEYEQLPLWYGDDVKSDQDSEGSSTSAVTREDTRRTLNHDVLDSEWELL